MRPIVSSHDDRYEMLTASGWAPSLTDSDRDILTKFLLTFQVKDNAVLFNEGDEGDSMGIVVAGRLCVLKSGEDGVPHRIAELPVGSAFGEMSLIDGGPRSAAVTAHPEATLLFLTRDNFSSLFQQYPTVASRILISIAQAMSLRLRHTNEMLLEALDSRLMK